MKNKIITQWWYKNWFSICIYAYFIILFGAVVINSVKMDTVQNDNIIISEATTDIKLDILTEEVKIISDNVKVIAKKPETVEEIIIRSAKKYNVSSKYMLKLAHCESTTNPNGIRYNYDKNGVAWSIDRGIFQINTWHHPEVSDTCAYNVECASMWTAWQISQGHGWMWTCIDKGLIK